MPSARGRRSAERSLAARGLGQPLQREPGPEERAAEVFEQALSDGHGSRPTRSALLIAPLFSTEPPGGLQLATIDLARELEQRGWHLRVLTSRAYPPASLNHGVVLPQLGLFDEAARRNSRALDRLAAAGARWFTADFVSRVYRRLRLLSGGLGLLRALSADLSTVDRILASQDADVVILVDYPQLPGLTALVNDRHPRVVVLSLVALAGELRARGWRTAAALARVALRGRVHPNTFRPVAPERLARVVFPSDAWRERAVAAGLPADAGHSIYFGAPLPAGPPAPTPASPALLFVGRLTPDKGLHCLLPGLARLRERRPEVTLTVVTGGGPAWYRAHCEKRIRRLGLENGVHWRRAVPRDDLLPLCRRHGALVFYSPNEEPVALVLLEAIAAGLPVVSSLPPRPGALVVDDQTCVCYDPADPASLASAVERLLHDDTLRARLVAHAYAVARRVASLEAMGHRWDALLRALVDSPSGRRDAPGGGDRGSRIS